MASSFQSSVNNYASDESILIGTWESESERFGSEFLQVYI